MSEVITTGPEEALVSDDPVVRIVARGAMSSWVEQFKDWVQDEARRSRGPIGEGDLLIAMTKLMVMTHSSVVANFMSEGGFPLMAFAIKGCVDEEYVRHAKMCREVVLQKRAAR